MRSGSTRWRAPDREETALDGDGSGSGAGYLGAHGNQAIRQINDFRLPRRILDDRRSLGECRRHQHDMGSANRDFRECIMGTDKAALRRRHIDIAAIDLDLGTQRGQALEEEINGTRADGAAARQRDASPALASQKRPDDPEACPHLRDQLIRSNRVDNGAAGKMNGAGIAFRLAFAAAIDGNVDPVIAKNAQQLLDIGQMRHVFQRQRIAGQKGRDHQRQSGILGAGNRNSAPQLIAAGNSDAIHKL
jgi:hypothetical protein